MCSWVNPGSCKDNDGTTQWERIFSLLQHKEMLGFSVSVSNQVSKQKIYLPNENSFKDLHNELKVNARGSSILS